jgi:hypothetical protein
VVPTRQTVLQSGRGRGFSAACYALAGRIEEARNIIEALGSEDQWRAAGIVFDVAHPVADAGDDLAAGPIMGLVVEFWPNHYMALYHAGAANFELGNEQVATDYLTRFLRHYPERDGWTARARDLLGAIDPHLVSLSR